MGELVWYNEVHEIVLPKFDKEYTEACVIEGEDVLTLRFEEKRNRETLCKHKGKQQRKMVTAGNGTRLGCAVQGALLFDW